MHDQRIVTNERTKVSRRREQRTYAILAVRISACMIGTAPPRNQAYHAQLTTTRENRTIVVQCAAALVASIAKTIRALHAFRAVYLLFLSLSLPLPLSFSFALFFPSYDAFNQAFEFERKCSLVRKIFHQTVGNAASSGLCSKYVLPGFSEWRAYSFPATQRHDVESLAGSPDR